MYFERSYSIEFILLLLLSRSANLVSTPDININDACQKRKEVSLFCVPLPEHNALRFVALAGAVVLVHSLYAGVQVGAHGCIYT